MHPNPEGLRHLHEMYAREARRRRFAPSNAVDHYLAAINPGSASKRHRRWVRACEQLEAHVANHGGMPTVRSTRHLPDSRSLVEWARYQRRNVDSLSPYQRSRLNLIPGWSWSPLEEAWLTSMQEYEFFVRAHQHRPRRRSSDRKEASLAIWFRNQRRMVRAGRLDADRLQMLTQLQRRVTALISRH